MNKTMLMLLSATTIMMGAATVQAKEPKMMSDSGQVEMQKAKDGKMMKEDMHKKMKEKRLKMNKKLNENLNLTEKQQAEVKAMREEAEMKLKPLKEQAKELRMQMEEIRDENIKKFESILTPEQKAKLEKIKAEGKNYKKKMHKEEGKKK